MRIYANVRLQGANNESVENAIIDTGAEISLMPSRIAVNIGAWCTNQQMNVVGVHGEARTLPIIVAHLHFPALNDVGGQFAFVMSNTERELLIGMDILNPLGITIDTQTHQLSIKNEIWEAFKTLAAVGVIIYGGVKLLEALSEPRELR